MLLEVRDIHKTFPSRNGAPVRAVEGVSLSVEEGDDLAIVGPSGCGKTTLARLIMGLTPADKGDILFDEAPVFESKEGLIRFRQLVRMVFQDPFASLDPRFTIRAVLEEALHLEPGLSADLKDGRMHEMLSAVRLSDDILGRHPHEFSGGERQRISIARALMSQPKLIILDEAVSSLDTLVRRDILLCLEELRHRRGVTYIFITHDLKAARYLCERAAVMEAGHVVRYGRSADIL